MFENLKARLKTSSQPANALAAKGDFLPEGYADRRRRRRTDAICLGLFVAVIGTTGVTITRPYKQLVRAEQEHREVDVQYADAARRIEQVRQMRLKQKLVADRIEVTASLLEKLPRSNLLADLTNALPAGLSLTDCTLEAKQVTAAPAPAGQTSFDQRRNQAAGPAPAAPQPLSYETTLTVVGVAYTEGQVSDFIDALGRSSYFSSVDLRWVRKGSSAEKTDDAMRTFMVTLSIDPTQSAREQGANPVTRVRLTTAAGE